MRAWTRGFWGGIFLLLAGCAGLSWNRSADEVTDQAWADRKTEILVKRLESFWGHRFQRIPRVQMVSPDSASMVLDSFPIVVRRDPVVRSVWKTVGLYRPGEEERLAAGKLRQVATRSLYVPAARRILLVPDGDPAKLEEALAHELVHAMQDEVFPMEQRIEAAREEDELVGLLGVLEGQAVYLADLLGDPSMRPTACPEPKSAMWKLGEAIRNTPEFAGIPLALVIPSYAPYVFGSAIVCRAVQRSGAAGLDTVLARPPGGSWLLWHPWQYGAHRTPEDWDTSWTVFRMPPAWHPQGQTRLGEVRLATLLLEWDRKGAGRLLRGQGLRWNGDRVWVFDGPDRRTAVVWNLSFDRDASARRFAAAWWKLRGIQLGETVPAAPRSRKPFDLRHVRKDGSLLRLQQVGRFVHIVDGLDEAAGDRTLRVLRRLPRRGG